MGCILCLNISVCESVQLFIIRVCVCRKRLSIVSRGRLVGACPCA